LRKITKNAQNLRQYNTCNIGNIYCLYAVTAVEGCNYHYIPKKFIDEFSDYRICVMDYMFLNRLLLKLKEEGYLFKNDLVSYYQLDENPKETTVFDKRNEYAYQNEYRVFVETNNNQPFKIWLGSLKDIVYEIDFNNKMLNIGGEFYICKEGTVL